MLWSPGSTALRTCLEIKAKKELQVFSETSSARLKQRRPSPWMMKGPQTRLLVSPIQAILMKSEPAQAANGEGEKKPCSSTVEDRVWFAPGGFCRIMFSSPLCYQYSTAGLVTTEKKTGHDLSGLYSKPPVVHHLRGMFEISPQFAAVCALPQSK